MQSRDLGKLVKLAELRAAIEQERLAPVDSKLRILGRKLADLENCQKLDHSATNELILGLRYDRWRDQRRQALKLGIAVAKEDRKPIQQSVAYEQARVEVLTKLYDRGEAERRRRARLQVLDDFS